MEMQKKKVGDQELRKKRIEIRGDMETKLWKSYRKEKRETVEAKGRSKEVCKSSSIEWMDTLAFVQFSTFLWATF